MKSTLLPCIVIATVISGCGDERVVQLSREAADRQAQQNHIVGKITEEQAKARQEVAEIQRGLQKERSYLNKLWSALDLERKQVAGERRTESMLTTATRGLGLILLALAAIGFAAMTIFGLGREREDSGQVFDLMVRRVLPSSAMLDPPTARVESEITKGEIPKL